MTQEIRYERDLSGAYMILEAQSQAEGGYIRPMILENKIPGFVPIQLCLGDMGEYYRYRISSLLSLEEYLQHHAMDQTLLKQLIFSLCQAVTQLGEYLLSETVLMLEPQTIFLREGAVGSRRPTVFFCLYPDEIQDGRRSLCQWIKWLMSQADPGDPHCGEMCYELYGIAQKDNFCLQEFMEALQRWAPEPVCAEPEKKKRSKQLFASRSNRGIIKPSQG